MDWRETVADGLPAPHEGEPPALRQDIRDELADHLRCAMDRELQRTTERDEARRNVLERFGDVRRIARRLWLEAMKEKLMTQRVTLALVALLVAVSIGTMALAWVAVQEGRQVNAAIVEKLNALPSKAETALLDWIPVRVECVLGREDGPPAAGFTVELTGNILQEQSLTRIETTGADGVASFGIVRPGQHSVKATTPWGESHFESVAVYPGEPFRKRIICPAQPPEQSRISVEVKLPDGMPADRYWVSCHFTRAPREIADAWWSIWAPPATSESDQFTLLMGPTGQVSDTLQITGRSLNPPILTVSGRFEPRSNVEWPSGKYRLTRLMIFLLDDAKALSGPKQIRPAPHEVHDFGEPPVFEAQPGSRSHWTVTVPEELVEKLRRRFPDAAPKGGEQPDAE